MGEELLIYGSYGYTGRLVTEAAVGAGLSPVLAGRRAEPIEAQATTHGLDHRVFSLEHPSVVERELASVDAVVNLAGPFSNTAESLVEASLAAGTDYLDVAGDVSVLEAVAERDRAAEKAGVTLLPAVGYAVAPTDCLAAHLESRLPSATRLTLGIDRLAHYSPGTVKSIVAGLSRPGVVREDGELRDVPAAWRTRELDFGAGPSPAVTVPWGDISTAYYSTGIPNIEVYAAVPEYAVEILERTRPLVPVLGTRPVRRALMALADAVVTGPSASERARGETRVWGEVEDDDGNRAAARLRTPDIYDVTAATTVAAAERVLDGEVTEGFQTPASGLGADFILEIDGVEREDSGEAAAVATGPAEGGD